MTCEPSRPTTEPIGGSTSLRGDSPARMPVQQTPEEPASTERRPAFGESSRGSFARYAPDSSLWKTSQGCLVEGLDEFSETWPKAGMTRNGSAYRLRLLMPVTKGNDSSSWPTPDASLANLGEGTETWLARREEVKAKKINGNGMRMPLSIAVQLWPTPQATDGHRAGLSSEAIAKAWAKSTKRPRGPCSILGYAVLGFHKRFPSPAARDWKGQGFSGQLPTVLRGYPNPTWVEWLMGFPMLWTRLDSGDSETPSSPRSPSGSADASSP